MKTSRSYLSGWKKKSSCFLANSLWSYFFASSRSSLYCCKKDYQVKILAQNLIEFTLPRSYKMQIKALTAYLSTLQIYYPLLKKSIIDNGKWKSIYFHLQSLPNKMLRIHQPENMQDLQIKKHLTKGYLQQVRTFLPLTL